MSKRMRLDCAQAFRASCEKLTLARREVFFRLAEPPDKMDFHFISPCGAKLYEVTEVKMEQNELQRTLMAILFAAGEPVAASRLSETLAVDVAQIHEELAFLMNELSYHRSGIRIVRLEDAYQMCSAAEQAEFVTRTLETRKPPKLSSSQLETLSVIAYYQPATKAYVEQIRGVDSGYSISALLTKKLIREAGRLNVPGRPFQYETTPDFLRVFGLQSLADLPPIEKVELSTNQAQLEISLEPQAENEQKETAQ